MKTTLIKPKSKHLQGLIESKLATSKSIDWAIAFGQYSAYKSLDNAFTNFFKNGGRSRAVFDLSAGITDPQLIWELITLPGESFCKVFCGTGAGRGIFHPKLYLFRNDEETSAIIGSANFSESAFFRNVECNLLIEGNEKTQPLVNLISFFEDSIWNSTEMVSPVADLNILKIYEELYDQTQKGRTGKHLKTVTKLEKLLQELTNAQRSQSKLGIDVAYIAGLLCGSAYQMKQDDLKNRTIKLIYKSGVFNCNDGDKGFICTRINGNILGDIRLPQITTQIDIVKRIYRDLKVFLALDDKSNKVSFEDNTRIMTLANIEIKFSKKSKVWQRILEYIKEFKYQNGKLIPVVPKDILDDKDHNIQQHFLKGYFDFRSRLSKGDRTGGVGKLRIGIQIDTKATLFAEQIHAMLEDLGIDSQISLGASRHRDNMVRITPTTDEVLNLWTAGWAKLLADSFIQFNNP